MASEPKHRVVERADSYYRFGVYSEDEKREILLTPRRERAEEECNRLNSRPALRIIGDD